MIVLSAVYRLKLRNVDMCSYFGNKKLSMSFPMGAYYSTFAGSS
jgi:hypothetical protein